MKLSQKRFQLNNRMAKPLVVVTRLDTPESSLSSLLESKGIKVLYAPMMTIHPPDSWALFDQIAHESNIMDWLVFTSGNAVKYWRERLTFLELTVPVSCRIAAIGQSTRKIVESFGMPVHLMAEESHSEGLLTAFEGHLLPNQRVWIPQAQETRGILEKGLTAMGGNIVTTPVYRNRYSEMEISLLLNALKQQKIDWITFTSSSAVHHLLSLMSPEDQDFLRQQQPQVACLGKITANTVKDYGLEVDCIPRKQTLEALVEAILAKEGCAAADR